MDNITTESISILTDRQIDYGAGDIATIRISPTECPLISGKNCFLRFNVILNGIAFLIFLTLYFFTDFLFVFMPSS